MSETRAPWMDPDPVYGEPDDPADDPFRDLEVRCACCHPDRKTREAIEMLADALLTEDDE